jgi:FAD/FMN-containing dehydrogenase
LTAYLQPLGYSLPVVPELDALTVGGLVNGVGIESSSHLHGLFQHQCLSFQIVTCEGELVACNKTANEDLFKSIPWSHGTLGFLVSVEIKIIVVMPYVELTYNPFYSKEEAILYFSSAVKENSYDFIEGLQYTDK